MLMISVVTLLVALANGSVLNWEQEQTNTAISSRPDFCNGIDCPEFQILQKTSDYELRRYNASGWVSTQITGIGYDDATSTMFMRLFKYISGNNVKKEKIDMTAPVLVRVIPGQGPACENNFTMSFYVSPNGATYPPPQPTDETVQLTKFPPFMAYVKVFGGRPREAEWLKEAEILRDSLKTHTFHKDFFYTAGYDSPFKIFNRHNEIWFFK